MAQLISEQGMKLYTSLEAWVIPYTKADMPDEIPSAVPEDELSTKRRVLFNDLAVLTAKPDFGTIQTATIQFTYIAPDSKLWGSPFFENKQALKDNYLDLIWLYSHWDFYNLTLNMGDKDTFEIRIYQSTCFGSIDLSGTNTEEEVKTSCGSYKFAKNDDSYTANISGYFEYVDEMNENSNFTSLLMKTKFGTQKEFRDSPKTYEEKQQQTWYFMPFLMSKKGTKGYEGYASFKGTINTAGLSISTESAVQQFQAPISVQGNPNRILRDYKLSELLTPEPKGPTKPAPKRGSS